MKIWIVSLFDPIPMDNTDHGRYLGIASAGIELGHEVVYFTSSFRHSQKVQLFNNTHSEKIEKNYEVVYIHSYSYQRHISIWRFFTYWIYTQNFRREIRKRELPDVVLLAYPPISTSFFISRWSKRKDIPFVIDVIDPWPDSFLKHTPKILRPVFRPILYPFFRKSKLIVSQCSGVIGISNKHVNWTEKFKVPVQNRQVFYPSVPFRTIRDKIENYEKEASGNPARILRLIYAGSLAVSYDIPVILKSAEVLNIKYPGKTLFQIVGAGYYQDMVIEYSNRCANIEFLGRLDHNDLLKYYAMSDLGLAQYLANATQSVTYKFFDYLSAGLPILNSLMAEMAVLTEQYKVGFNNPPGDSNKLVDNIEMFLHDPDLLKEYKKNALRLTAELGDNEVVYKRLIDFLQSIV